MRSIYYPRYVAAAAVSMVMLSGALTTALAQNTPTEEIADCVANAWDKNYQCQTDDSWLNDLPCAIKFLADAILCVFPRLPR